MTASVCRAARGAVSGLAPAESVRAIPSKVATRLGVSARRMSLGPGETCPGGPFTGSVREGTGLWAILTWEPAVQTILVVRGMPARAQLQGGDRGESLSCGEQSLCPKLYHVDGDPIPTPGGS